MVATIYGSLIVGECSLLHVYHLLATCDISQYLSPSEVRTSAECQIFDEFLQKRI